MFVFGPWRGEKTPAWIQTQDLLMMLTSDRMKQPAEVKNINMCQYLSDRWVWDL